ncbi:hypothetical protein NIES593_15025 [Hydrococcus rivularis NIES-593]|uniref:Inner membrane protein YgaP-like transmembrane domain-containing protein n=1 Tax=Hydrococcus rivularis NIES-593 TaxID=1921803 RepID=A0A1U7HDU9_9CYAN|nr:DUF2892 domain-containing protein [Hydrococcus rivularis]OKH21734.1 hypothetical protein NIES593_15025 [Hydrococcus rivularis NIES-593]
MFNNVGTIDRFIRFGLAGTLLYLGLGVYGGSALGIGLAIISIIPALTALIGTCPLYSLLGINTKSQQPQQN